MTDLSTDGGVELEPGTPYEERPRTVVWRLAVGVIGVGGIAYGVVRILQSPAAVKPLDLFLWLIGALILHDAILAPILTVFGFLMARLIPGRARAYIQGGLIAGGLVATFSLVEIYRRGKSRPGNALLEQDYTRHLLLVLGVIAVLTVVLYLSRVLRERARR